MTRWATPLLCSQSFLRATRNPAINLFYQRLCQAGKAKKLALTACMRKLLTILNVPVKSRMLWRVTVTLPA
jgi:transposase